MLPGLRAWGWELKTLLAAIATTAAKNATAPKAFVRPLKPLDGLEGTGAGEASGEAPSGS